MHRSKNPSFSSTLLDDIYNSIDPKTHKTQSFSSSSSVSTTTKKQSITVNRKTHFFGSVSSSSDSNSSIFSSSDTELTHGNKKITSSRPLCFGPSSKTKPKKKTEHRQNRAFSDYDYASDVPKSTRYEEGFERRSSRDVKRPKTPASPGGRIVSFINSLFSNNSKQARKKMNMKPNDYHHHHYDHPLSISTCSSVTSFSRSCLNKSSEKSSDPIKRSVRFSPVNVIVPERKSVKKNVEDGGRRSVEEIAREFLRDYHKKKIHYDDEDDDDASDCSSDLFELDLVGSHHHHHNNLYGDELPVYETTFAGLIL